MKKGVMLIGLVVLILGVLIGGGGFLFYWGVSSLREATKAADEFLALISQGKEAEAYANASGGLRDKQSKEQFAAAVAKIGLKDYASSEWPGFNIKNNTATLEGKVTLKKGGTIPVTMTLVNEDGAWRVMSVEGPQVVAASQKRS